MFIAGIPKPPHHFWSRTSPPETSGAPARSREEASVLPSRGLPFCCGELEKSGGTKRRKSSHAVCAGKIGRRYPNGDLAQLAQLEAGFCYFWDFSSRDLDLINWLDFVEKGVGAGVADYWT